ncbi:NAD(P)/FAD-dependent oxidoreductase [Pseudomonas sp.]|uniref:NAD(P)/FAD-dependent oxidoreductase n=1 Tax=Pseudomonas sp. TaxID=306 RepID=UPI003CC615A1
MNAAPAPLIIVGAGHAGGRAALTLREQGYDGRLLLIGDEAHAPYERPSLSKGALQGTAELDGYRLSAPEELSRLGIEHWAGRPVQALDTQGKQVHLADGSCLAYSGLLLATGGSARRLPGVAAGWSNVRYLRTHDEAVALRASLVGGSRLVVVGGGFIGLEVAASARAMGCTVTLLEAGPRLAGRVLPAQVSQALLTLHAHQGVDVRLNARIQAFEGNDRVERVRLEDGSCVACDGVVAGIGMQPNVDLARAAGLTVGQGIRVDAYLRSSDPHVFAAGDVCEFRLHPQGEFQRQETWRNAELQGRHAALNLLGAEEPFQQVPGFWSDQYDHGLQTVGLLRDGPASARRAQPGGFLLFYLDDQQRLQGACGWGAGNSVAKDIKLCERLILAGQPLAAGPLADPAISLKTLLRN